MTKNIRIENADTSQYKVIVEVWENRYDSEGFFLNDVKVEEFSADHPTAMVNTYITSDRYLVVREVK